LHEEHKTMCRSKRIHGIISALLLCTLVTTTTGCPANRNPFDAQLEFTQLDFDVNGNVTMDSSWGSVVITHTGSSEILYFNLAVNNAHVVKNLPILSQEGEGVENGAIVRFNLGVSNSTDVSTLDYAFSLDTDVENSAPARTQAANVSNEWTVFYDGIIDSDAPKGDVPAPPDTLEGGLAVGAQFHGTRFPNQECGLNECCPVAVSNSLHFLRERHDLPLADEDISIDAMKEATGWNDGGCDKDTWWQLKDEVMRDKGITTRQVVDFEEIFDEIRDGHDVELIMQGHAVVVTGLVRLENGQYEVQLVHDTQQGIPGGTQWPEYITYDSNTGRFSGDAWVQDRLFLYFVVESPTE
jgi:hypothetical protein